MATAGLSTTESSKPRSEPARPSPWRSTTARIVLLLVAFASFPAIVYRQLHVETVSWTGAEFHLVALAYIVLVALVLGVVFGLVQSLRRLESAIRAVRIGANTAPSFVSLNHAPELATIAGEFDRMVRSLRGAAEESRAAADETAHAFKTPIATIMHALMPLRGAIAPGNARALRSIELIEQTAARLDALVVASRRMEQARCRVLHPPCWRLDLGPFIRDAVASKQALLDDPALRLDVDADSGIHVYGNDDILETVIDHLIDNAAAVSVSPATIRVSARVQEDEAICCVEDDGPGLPAESVDRVFDPYFSYRPAVAADGDETAGRPPRYGIGLWVVRRNVEALGGKVWAENRASGGLRIVITLPLA